MNIQEYISSGIVESYVLGLVSPKEKKEFEKLSSQYPQLITARTDFELLLEKKMLESVPVPGLAVHENIMKTLRQSPLVNQTPIITMEHTQTKRSSSLGWVAAIAIILLAVAGYFAYDFYSKNEKLKKELAASTGNTTKLEELQEGQKWMNDPNVAVVNLKGTEKAPKSSASVYWDSTAGNVYVVIKNMPKLASDKQYQLWSIINGQDGGLQPSDMGLFDVGDDGKIILKKSGPKKADMFAITIENKGNTAGPNLNELQVIGKTAL